MTATDVGAALGHLPPLGTEAAVICPVHGSRAGGSLTVAVRDGDPGLVVHCHAGRNQDILAELRPLGGLWAKSHFR